MYEGKTDYRQSRLNSVPRDLLPLLNQRFFDNTKVYQNLENVHNVNFTLFQPIGGKHCSFFTCLSYRAQYEKVGRFISAVRNFNVYYKQIKK